MAIFKGQDTTALALAGLKKRRNQFALLCTAHLAHGGSAVSLIHVVGTSSCHCVRSLVRARDLIVVHRAEFPVVVTLQRFRQMRAFLSVWSRLGKWGGKCRKELAEEKTSFNACFGWQRRLNGWGRLKQDMWRDECQARSAIA